MDTTVGAAPFPATTAGFLELLRAPGREGDLIDLLARRYWKSIYAYLRVAWAKSHDDAKDLTQAFLVYLLEEGVLASYARERGVFRPFLKTLLRRFVGHEETALRRLKRGGGRKILSLEGAAPSLEEVLKDPAAAEPSAIFDRVWATELLSQALERVRARSEATAFAMYEAFDLATPALRPTYAELAARHGMDAKDVKRHLFRIREDVRREVRAGLAALTPDARALDDEWHGLLRL